MIDFIPLVVFYAIYEADSPFHAPVVQLLRHKIAHHIIHHIMAWAGPAFVVNTIGGGIPGVTSPPKTTRRDALSFAVSRMRPIGVDTC